MLKKALMIGLAVSVGLVALHAVTAEAGWSYLRPPGMWWWYGSINGCGTITQIRNPETHPARLSCEVRVTAIETLCDNPAGNEVPGEAATQVSFFTETDFGDGLLNDKDQKKKKNRADVCVAVDEDDCSVVDEDGEPLSPLCRDEYCVNPNWHIIDVLTTEFTATCTTQTCSTRTVDEAGNCIDGDWLGQDTQVCECSLPSGWDVRNKPPDCNDDLGIGCVAYECFRVVDGFTTNEPCEFQE
jgi:hypothetical protein